MPAAIPLIALCAGTAILLGLAPPSASAADTEPLDRFGPNVYIFSPRTPQSQIQSTADRIAKQQIDNEFGNERYALLFEPGSYGSREHPLNLKVGYYTAIAGLGASPRDVTIKGSVQVRNRCFNGACIALDNFYRSLSNLSIDISSRETGCYAGEIWAVSQGAPMRRVRVTGGDLRLWDSCTSPGFSSGGFIADSQFGGQVINGTQQQFLVRNSALSAWRGGNWNQVFSGVLGAPAECFPASATCGPYTTIAQSAATREAPFLHLDSGRRFQVRIPSLQHRTAGTTWADHPTRGESIPLAKFYIASPGGSAAAINAALKTGKNLLLTPGIYHLDQSIVIERADTMVIGLGFPTLTPEGGVVPMTVRAPKGVSISGIIFDAGSANSAELLQVGLPAMTGETQASSDEASSDPTALHDVFFRVGGAHEGRATVSLTVNSHHVILDHVWAWRADHGNDVGWTQNTADTGLVVNGNNVSAYGLFVEHYQKQEVIWNGDNGRVVFFQNEMPYDPPGQEAWSTAPGLEGYAALTVNESVKRFSAFGMGSYSYFNQGVAIFAANAFQLPATLPPGSVHNLTTIFLNPRASGGIRNVVNGQGGSSTAANPDIPVTVPSYP
jgi:hypothetical protein